MLSKRLLGLLTKNNGLAYQGTKKKNHWQRNKTFCSPAFQTRPLRKISPHAWTAQLLYARWAKKRDKMSRHQEETISNLIISDTLESPRIMRPAQSVSSGMMYRSAIWCNEAFFMLSEVGKSLTTSNFALEHSWNEPSGRELKIGHRCTFWPFFSAFWPVHSSLSQRVPIEVKLCPRDPVAVDVAKMGQKVGGCFFELYLQREKTFEYIRELAWPCCKLNQRFFLAGPLDPI